MLFNKDNNGSAELKELIGFIYRSISFTNLQSYIGFAERDIKKIISKEVFQVAQDHYDSDNYQAPEPDPPGEGEEPAEEHPEFAILDELVARIQYPVAIHAYRKYAPNADLTHSDKGRQILVTENEKPAFEWMLEKDNDNLLRLANEATDILIEFLDDHADDTIEVDGEDVALIPWKDSDIYVKTKGLFIHSVEQFEEIFRIGGSRLTFLSLVPFMKRVQDNELKPCFSTTLYSEIIAEILEGEISDDNQLILDRARQPLALLTLSVAAKRLTTEFLPDGLFINQFTAVVKSKMASVKVDRNEVSVNLERDGMRELRKLQDYLAKLAAEEAGTTIEEVDLTAHIDPDDLFVRL